MRPLAWALLFPLFLVSVKQAPENVGPTPAAVKNRIQNRKSSNPESYRENKKSKEGPKTTGVGSLDRTKICNKKKNHSSSEPSNTLYQVSLWATIIGVGGGLVGLYFIGRQVNATRDSVKVAWESAKAIIVIEKPWVLVTIKSPDFAELVRSHLSGTAVVVCRAENYGNKPVWITHYTISSTYGPLLEEVTYPKATVNAETAFPPGQFVDLAVNIRSSALPDLVSGKTNFYIYGRVAYRDTLGGVGRETRFCFQYHAALAGSNLLPGFYPGGPSKYNECT